MLRHFDAPVAALKLFTVFYLILLWNVKIKSLILIDKCSGLCDDSCFIIPPGDKTRQNGALKKVYVDVLFDKERVQIKKKVGNFPYLRDPPRPPQ